MGRHKNFKNFANASKYNLLSMKPSSRRGEVPYKEDTVALFQKAADMMNHAQPKKKIPPLPELFSNDNAEIKKAEEYSPFTQEFPKTYEHDIPSPDLFASSQEGARAFEEEKIPTTAYVLVAGGNILAISQDYNYVDPNAVVPIIELGNSPTGYDE